MSCTLSRLFAVILLSLGLLFAGFAQAENSVIVVLLRIDDYYYPTQNFSLSADIRLDVSGVTAVTLTRPDATPHSLALTGGGGWEMSDATFPDLPALLAAADGTWTLSIDGTTPSISSFDVGAASAGQADFFATPSNLSPANGATGVPAGTLLSWNDPSGPLTPFALFVGVGGNGGFQEVSNLDFGIDVTATSWQPPLALETGVKEFNVFYVDPRADLVSALSLNSGAIVWGTSSFAPPGYPDATPLLALGSESVVAFTVPEPGAALLQASVLAVLATFARGRRRSA